VGEVNVTSQNLPKIIVRLPKDVKNWLLEQAAENASSQTSEIVRAVRERMERQQKTKTDFFEEPLFTPKIAG
jgi:hypothetical protein